VREGYEHARRHGVVRLGYLPGWIKPLVGRDLFWSLNQNEGCGAADFVMLGIKLSDARLGDCWDDVDAVVRNHFAELQATDLERMRTAAGGNAAHDDVLRGFVGGFSQASLTGNLSNAIFGCCTANGSRALYYAWEGITRFDPIRREAVVNLLLNRVSAWLDVASFLPGAGKVVLRNKQARSVSLRIPCWVDPATVGCWLNDQPADAARVGRYLVVAGLQVDDVIRVEFAVPESTERYHICGETYTASLRGSTVVDVSPRHTDKPEHRGKYPFFVREELEVTSTPVRRVTRFLPQRLLPCD
jgi:hypothetical protein